VHDDEVVELRSLRERYRRQLEHYRAFPGIECPPPVQDPAKAVALEAAWRAVQGAYHVWRDAYERWDDLRKGA